MSINTQNIVNVRGENLNLDVLTKTRPPSVCPGYASTSGYTPLMRYGATLQELKGINPDCHYNYELYGRWVGIYELACALKNERNLSAGYKSSMDSLQQRCTQLESNASKAAADLQTTLAKLRVADTKCGIFEKEAQAMKQAAADIAELKAALQNQTQTSLVVKTENQKLARENEQLKSEIAELNNRLAVQKRDCDLKIETLRKKHAAKIGVKLDRVDARLQKIDDIENFMQSMRLALPDLFSPPSSTYTDSEGD